MLCEIYCNCLQSTQLDTLSVLWAMLSDLIAHVEVKVCDLSEDISF
jgi:hypothetical protein